jgi:hypothetical protein
MMPDDELLDDDASGEDASEAWHPPMRCPQCAGLNTRFVSMTRRRPAGLA